MPRLWLVRHGRAASAYDAHPDPGLDEVGAEQAQITADRLESLGPLRVLVSPLRRTRETAQPLEQRWETTAVVEPRVAEIPAPTDDLEERGEWIRQTMVTSWDTLGDDHQKWRADALGALTALESDTVVFTHFIAINAAIGAARGESAVVCEMVGNGSVTILDVDDEAFRLVEVGSGDVGRVN